MVLINEAGDYEDIKAVIRATTKEAPSWAIRSDWRDRVVGAFAIERAHGEEIKRLISQTQDEAVRDTLARIFLEEETHQAIFGSLLCLEVPPWEHLINAELALISVTSTLAQAEPDSQVKAFFDYLICDHLTHAKALLRTTTDMGQGSRAVADVENLPEGRPMEEQFYLTSDLILNSYPHDADSATKANVRLVTAMDTLVRDLLGGIIFTAASRELVELCSELGAVEAEHQLALNTLLNPTESVLERAFYSELAELTGLNRLLVVEKERGAKDAYDFAVEEDETHLQYIGGMLINVEEVDPGKLSDSKALTAKPRRKLENYLPEIAKGAALNRLSEKAIKRTA